MSVLDSIRQTLMAAALEGVRVSEVSLPMDRFYLLCGQEDSGAPPEVGGWEFRVDGPLGHCRVRGYGTVTREGLDAWCEASLRRLSARSYVYQPAPRLPL